MQNAVLFGILLTILNKKIVKREQLSEKYEVSQRTVMRYIDVLCESGVPIISLRGKGGGYTIPDNYKLDKTYFTDEELVRIINCLKATKTNFEDKISDQVLDKMSTLQQNKFDESYFLKSDTLIIDAGTWNNPQKFRDKITTINKAIEGGYSIYMTYIDNKELKSSRMTDPYSLVLKEGIWYVYCWCHFRKDFRLFKLSRIQFMTITNSVFEKRESDIYAKLNANFDQNEMIDIEFEFSSMIYSDIEEWLGIDSITERGTIFVASANLYAGNMLMNKLMSFGSSIKILKPHFLKEEIHVECKRILNLYQTQSYI